MGEAVRDNLNGMNNRRRTHLYRMVNPEDEWIRKAAARLAIYRKLKDIGISDERIVHVYQRVNRFDQYRSL